MIAKGQKINDRYEIEKLIGEGGMANVYLAKDTILDREVAVKVLRGDLSNDEKFVRRFQREAQSSSSLSHPNIVEIYDVGEDEGNFYIVMEYIEGKTLKQLIKKRGVLSLPEVMDIMMQLLDALAVAHDACIIHRDIKPQNIMIKESGLIKITDFGIAMALNSVELTQTNSVMGSVHYLPPEQASGKGSTVRSDIYSLGILMFEMLTGKMPFRGDSAVEIALKHMKEPLPSAMEINPVIPQSVENIIIKAAAKNPKNRYRDVRQMKEDIKTCLDEEREDEKKIVFKYPETEFFDTHKTSSVKEELNTEKKVKNNTPVARQITEDEKIEKGNKNKTIIISVIGAIFVIALVLLIVVFPKISAGKEIEVPNVYNFEIAKAEKSLRDAGFKFESIEKPSDDIEKGYVIETEPSKNRFAKKNSKVIIYYSSGTKKIEIGDYVGKNVYEIKAKLELEGFTVKIVKKDVQDADLYDGKEQLIIEQSIASGELVSVGEVITLYIPNILKKYPDMVIDGWTVERVNEFCEKYGLTIKVTEKETDEAPEGTVLAQKPKANEEIFDTDIVKVVIAKKPKVTTTTTTTTTSKNDTTTAITTSKNVTTTTSKNTDKQSGE